MSLSNALESLRSTSRHRDRRTRTNHQTEPRRGMVFRFPHRRGRPEHGCELETLGYKSLLSEDAIPELQRALVSTANTILAMSEGDELRSALKVMELEGTILGLLQHVRVLRNHARPIGRLPPELLSMIFKFAVTPQEDDSTPTFKDVVPLTHVCRYWRAILLNHNGFWSDIHLKGQDPGLITQQLGRCGDAALSLNVHLQYWMFRRENTRLLNNLRGALKGIHLHRDQIRRLVVHIACCQAFHQYFDFDFPNLEELVWEDLCVQRATTHNSTPPDPGRNSLPRLRHLSVKRSLYWPMEFTSGLTSFKLEGHITVPSNKLVDFLQQNPLLESLELVNLHVPYQWSFQQPIDLPCLGNLSIRNAEHGHIFPHVALPALGNLEIGPFEQPPRWVASVWSSLQVPSEIDTLTITYRGHGMGQDRISIAGFDKTLKRSLVLEEHSIGRRFTPVFDALANASLELVTTLSFDEEGSSLEGQAPTTPILALLQSLPRLQRADLGWDYLIGKTIACLNAHRGLCPDLKDLRVKVTGQSCPSTFGSVQKLVVSRANAGQWLRQVECTVSRVDSDAETVNRSWDSLFQASNLASSLRDR